ncbi:hypothetical protein TNCV_1512061 [Trichonephila clavipes]|nr:hypothetical protein TNCV_1512061 [Trichonephila clavipes]
MVAYSARTTYANTGLPTWQVILNVSIVAIVLFSSIVRDFLELFYNLWRTVLAKNKIVLDPALWLQSFRTPKTQQLVSEVGLNANNKSDGGPVPDSSRKIDRQHECQYGRNEIATGMNANMGEMKSELTASMNANMTEMKRS